MTDYKTAKEEILGTYSLEEFQKISEQGCYEGVASKHPTTKETNEFLDKYEEEINEYITNYIGGEFLSQTMENNDGNLVEYKHDVAYAYINLIAFEMVDENA